eukprot:EG_transcript_356
MEDDALAQLKASCPNLFSQNFCEEDLEDDSKPVKRLKTEHERRPKPPKPKKTSERARSKVSPVPGNAAQFYTASNSQPVSDLVLPELEQSDEGDVDEDFPVEDDEEAAPNLDLDDIVFTEEVEEIAKVKPEVAPPTVVPTTSALKAESPLPAAKKVQAHSPGAYKMPLAETVPRTSKVTPTGPMPVGNQTMMYWLDAKEDTFGAAGTVYIFGKTWDAKASCWKSCCLRVNNISRCIYVLPRKEKISEDGSPVAGVEPTMLEVVEELGQVMAEHNISKRRMKAVDRWYAFEEEGVPREKTKWIKVRYPASCPPLNVGDCSKFKTFQRAFGANRSFLELLLLKRKLKGPSWLSINGAVPVNESNQITWASVEWMVESPKAVVALPDSDLPPPPITVMSLNMLTFLNEKQKVNEIAAITCIVNHEVSLDGCADSSVTKWTAIRRVGETVFPYDLEKVFSSKKCPVPKREQTEKALLTSLMTEIQRTDPDMFVGHNFMGFDLDVLLHRLAANNIGNWSRIGKLRLRQMPRLQTGAGGTGESTWEEKAVMSGRLVADTYLLAREYLKESSYKLLSLAVSQGLEGPTGPITEDMVEEEAFFDVSKELNSSEGIFKVVHWCDTKAVLSLALMYKMSIIPLTKRLTTLAGNLWSRTLTGSRAERIEYLLLHKFHAQKFIVPDKQKKVWEVKDDGDKDEGEGHSAGRAKAKYAGGKVLEPKRGLYTDYVLLLDFNSLYPSIIQEYNVCFTTVERTERLADGTYSDPPVPSEDCLLCDDCRLQQLKAEEDGAGATALVPKGQSCRHRCILPKAIKELVDSRRQVKKLLAQEKDPQKREVLDIRQKALKLTANSIYGCLGFQSSRFYAQAIAQLVTGKGREALTNTVELVPKIDSSLDVIYGDTDSVMISTGMQPPDVAPALRMANAIKKEVNKVYRCLEIDIDGIFKSILLLRKKKYACLMLKDLAKGDRADNIKQEVKGLDMVRRDWCGLSQATSQVVLNCILSGRPMDEILDSIHAHLSDLADKVRNHQVELKEYVITKSLTKAPEQYADRAIQPHVQVALRMKEQKQSVQTHDLIPYIICDSESINPEVLRVKSDFDKSKLANKAFHYDEVRNPALGLKPDLEWYLATQIHPPVARLCEQIQGMDSHYIAETLGLQGSRWVVHTTAGIHAQPSLEYRYTTHRYDVSDEQRYADCDPFRLPCKHCGNQAVDISVKQRLYAHIERAFNEGTDLRHVRPTKFFVCEVCGGTIPHILIYNTLLLKIRQHQQRYYSQFGPLSTHTPIEGDTYPYPDQRLRHQLTYYSSLFDFKNAKDQVYSMLQSKLLAPLKKQQPALAVQQERRLHDLHRDVVNKTLPEDIDNPSKCLLKGTELRAAEQLKSNLEELTKLIHLKLHACKKHFVDVEALFGSLGLPTPCVAVDNRSTSV